MSAIEKACGDYVWTLDKLEELAGMLRYYGEEIRPYVERAADDAVLLLRAIDEVFKIEGGA